jgi:hypothetical protein
LDRPSPGPARHELPEIDEAALALARLVEIAHAWARSSGAARWAAILEPLPDHLRDDPPPGVRRAAIKVRAAYGPKDSIRDALPAEVTEPLLVATDRLIRLLNRLAARGGS